MKKETPKELAKELLEDYSEKFFETNYGSLTVKDKEQVKAFAKRQQEQNSKAHFTNNIKE